MQLNMRLQKQQIRKLLSDSYISDSQILLSIADNGRGLPVEFESKKGASMGMELLQGLTDDLGGSFSIEKFSFDH